MLKSSGQLFPQLCETAAERPGGNIGGLGEETEELPVLWGKLGILEQYHYYLCLVIILLEGSLVNVLRAECTNSCTTSEANFNSL